MQVVKRDGKIENFEESKVERVVLATGLDPQQAKTLAQNLSNWVCSCNLTQITSLEIRDKILENLRNINPHAANLFEWYQKTKDK